MARRSRALRKQAALRRQQNSTGKVDPEFGRSGIAEDVSGSAEIDEHNVDIVLATMRPRDIDMCRQGSSPSKDAAQSPKPADYESDSRETMTSDTDDNVLCLYCYEPLGDENPVVDTTAWDTQSHTTASPSCGVFERSCAKCLLDFVNMHEREPEKAGGYPCPLCRFALRVPSRENTARRTCAQYARMSAQFRLDCQAFLASLRGETIPLTSSRVTRVKAELKERDRVQKASLDACVEELPEIDRSSWFREARKNYEQDHELYREVRTKYRALRPATRSAVPHGTRNDDWQEYDPVMWETAGADS